MTYKPYPNPISISVDDKAAPAGVKVVFQPAPEKAAVGQPGKAAGDLLLNGQTLLVSLGKPEKLTLEAVRQAGGALANWVINNNCTALDVDLPSLAAMNLHGSGKALAEGLWLGAFRFNQYKTDADPLPAVKVNLRGAAEPKPLTEALVRIEKLCAAVNMARDWQHQPANVINPLTLAERVTEMAAHFGLKCTVLDDAALAELKAGAILDVGKGSKTPARMIILEYPGHNPDPDAKPTVLIGKALTFDTGGYSLKSVENILGMKYDKCGGVDVAAALQAAAALQVKNPVVGIIGAAENMVSDKAYRPDDIVTAMSGKTIEIISTDAEGRLVLADCLTYAQKFFQPAAMIDLATLTGGVGVALGRVRAGLMSNDDTLASHLFEAGEKVHERLWRLPLDEEYVKLIKADDADIKNSGGRQAHAIIGGTFLRQFVDDSVPWAHLDIASVADADKDMPYCPKGGTGFGIRLLLDYLEAR